MRYGTCTLPWEAISSSPMTGSAAPLPSAQPPVTRRQRLYCAGQAHSETTVNATYCDAGSSDSD